MSNLVNAMCEIFQITQHHTSSYHPQTNGLVERQNSTIAQSLRTYCKKNQSDWPIYLSSIMMAFRKSPCSNTIEYSPFHMMFGEDMRLPFDIAVIPKDNLGQNAIDHVDEIKTKLKIVHEIASANDKRNKAKDKDRHDKNAKTPDFRIGDRVLKAIYKVPVGQSHKLCDKFEGPYRIERLGENYTCEVFVL